MQLVCLCKCEGWSNKTNWSKWIIKPTYFYLHSLARNESPDMFIDVHQDIQKLTLRSKKPPSHVHRWVSDKIRYDQSSIERVVWPSGRFVQGAATATTDRGKPYLRMSLRHVPNFVRNSDDLFVSPREPICNIFQREVSMQLRASLWCPWSLAFSVMQHLGRGPPKR